MANGTKLVSKYRIRWSLAVTTFKCKALISVPYCSLYLQLFVI